MAEQRIFEGSPRREVEIIIPAAVEKDLREGVMAFRDQFFEKRRGKYRLRNDAPEALLVLGNSGALAWHAFLGFAEEHGVAEQLPKTILLPIGRKISDRYSSPTRPNVEGISSGVVVGYNQWLLGDEKAQKLVKELARQLASFKEERTLGVAVVDDVLQTGATLYFTAPLIISQALDKLGFGRVNSTDHRLNMIMTWVGNRSARKRADLSVHTLLTDPEWKFKILRASLPGRRINASDIESMKRPGSKLHEKVADKLKEIGRQID